MAHIHIDFSSVIARIKPMHAVGQPPFAGGSAKINFAPMQVLTDANIPYSRMHDVGGPFGGNRYIDVPNIFRDFDADVNDPASYDFAFTDTLLAAVIEHGVKPYFRLGVTIENQSFIKAYRIHPPKDYQKWAEICEHIIRHYNDGWCEGFHYGIEYWEIWNEPDNRHDPKINQMWTGTAQQLYELYDVAAKHLKKCFGNQIKVGGYAATGFYGMYADPQKYGVNVAKREGTRYESEKESYRMQFFFGFLDYIRAHNSPIDFFSWHAYTTADTLLPMVDFVNKTLAEYGYGNLEIHINEWNNSHERLKNSLSSYASAQVAATMSAMQNKKVDMMMYYDARYSPGTYGCFFDPMTYKPTNVYYSFKSFGALYALKNQTKSLSDDENVYCVAAADGDQKAVMITNAGETAQCIHTNLQGRFDAYLIDLNHLMTKVELDPAQFVLEGYQVVLLKSAEAK